MSVGIIIGLLILLVVVTWVLYPLVVAQQERLQLESSEANQKLENLLFERETALLAIRDLQFDHQMAKLSDEDFAQLDARYRAHAIEILRQLDELGVVPDEEEAPAADSLDAWIERAVKDLRQGKPRAATA
ncbi:MAG: hypothetical protein ACPGWR_32215 [Ardenticatenaceae bacterium]